MVWRGYCEAGLKESVWPFASPSTRMPFRFSGEVTLSRAIEPGIDTSKER